MQIRRVLLALSFASSAMSVAFADYQSLNNNIVNNSTDRLEQLSRTLSSGTYTTVSYRSGNNQEDAAPIELNNATLSSKYGASTGGLSAWMVTHPIKNARVSSEYGMRTLLGSTRHHSGIDFSAPSGTPIYATGPGIVTKSGWGSGYGNYVEIDHGNGYMTRYAHASRLNVSVGDRVNAGEHIANVGCTGRCTGPHLHFEVVKSGQRQNPSTYLALLP